MFLNAVGRAFPPHYADQDTLIAAFRDAWVGRYHNVARIEQLHRNVLVGGRHLALPMTEYLGLDFTKANEAFVRVATDVGAAARYFQQESGGGWKERTPAKKDASSQ